MPVKDDFEEQCYVAWCDAFQLIRNLQHNYWTHPLDDSAIAYGFLEALFEMGGFGDSFGIWHKFLQEASQEVSDEVAKSVRVNRMLEEACGPDF